MAETCLLPETTVREAGAGSPVRVDPDAGMAVLTLSITRTVEHESLEVSIWGSPDGAYWGNQPLLKLPLKYYCGDYQHVLDLSEHPDVRYLRARWRVSGWRHGDRKPLFTVRLQAQQSRLRALAAGA